MQDRRHDRSEGSVCALDAENGYRLVTHRRKTPTRLLSTFTDQPGGPWRRPGPGPVRTEFAPAFTQVVPHVLRNHNMANTF